MRKLLLGVVAMVALTSAAQAGWSPNGFSAGQCTFYCDGRTNEAGWKLTFSQNYGRDAYKWPSLVTNGWLYGWPWAGDVVVFDSQTGVPYGHVAYAESVNYAGNNEYDIVVTHMNWATGTIVRYVSGYAVRQATLRIYYRNNVLYGKFQGRTKEYKLKGFLGR